MPSRGRCSAERMRRQGTPRWAAVWLAALLLGGCASSEERRPLVLDNRAYYPAMMADHDAPLSYLGVYVDQPIPHTVTSEKLKGAEGALSGRHLFFNVGLGERLALAGFDYPADGLRPHRGAALYLDAQIRLIMDFFAESIAVLDTDFHIGFGVMGRGLPWWSDAPWLDHVAWDLKLYHESTHIGDEYLGDALERRDAGEPEFSDFRRVNVAFEAVKLSLAVDGDVPGVPALKGRVYGAYGHLLTGPWSTQGEASIPIAAPSSAWRHEAQLGLELRRPLHPGAWGPDAVVSGHDVKLRRQYDYVEADPDGRLLSFNNLVGVEWGEASRPGLVVRTLLHGYHGVHPRGQFRSLAASYLGFMLQADY